MVDDFDPDGTVAVVRNTTERAVATENVVVRREILVPKRLVDLGNVHGSRHRNSVVGVIVVGRLDSVTVLNFPAPMENVFHYV